ncbi:MAG: hydrolase [Candidatus Bathyarchaeia archaeon]
MPFTTYHLGISLLIGYLLRRKLDWPTLILSSAIVDLEPLVAIVAGLNHPPHGLLHTFLALIFAGTLVGSISYLVREQVAPYLADLALVDKEGSLKSFILAGIVGWASHVLLDSLLLYPEMKPFYPLNFNPMFLLKSGQIIFTIYDLLFIAGVLVYPLTYIEL